MTADPAVSGPRARPSAVVVLAAGEGTRMRSRTPKVLHPLAGRSMLGHVLAAAAELAPEHLVVVVGHGREAVSEHVHTVAPQARTVIQAEQHGTGHAVRLALADLSAQGVPLSGGPVVVLTGDTPLLTGATLLALVATHMHSAAAATMLTARLPDPTGYGRVLRAADGSVRAVVEHKDATATEREIGEINSGMYAFEADRLAATVHRLTTQNVQGEEYLTDVLGLLAADGDRVAALLTEDAEEILGVNDRVQLAHARRLLSRRINESWQRAGVTLVDPDTTWIDVAVQLEPDVTVLPHTQLLGATTIERDAIVGPDTTLSDCTVGAGARVERTSASGARIGARATVGPFSFLRPGTVLGEKGKIGAYVEIKNSTIGPGSKVPHLSYVGDATIGTGTNIGAATIFVNYDGVAKHATTVGDHVRVGSDSMLVAPVRIGDGAYTAAGSVITDDVPPGAMAVGRARQRNIDGWVGRRRPGTSSADAAARSDSDRGEHTHDSGVAEPGSSSDGRKGSRE